MTKYLSLKDSYFYNIAQVFVFDLFGGI